MGAKIRHIEDLRSSTVRGYWTAKCWMGVLEQRTFWVPRGSWSAYVDASLVGVSTQDVLGEIDGEAVVSGPVRSTLFCRPNFDVEGVVRVADMEISWRQNVVSFLWRKHSKSLCRALANGSLHVSDPFADDLPDDVFDEILEADFRYHDLARDDNARYEWFNSLPLVDELRNSIVVDRDIAIGAPVLLGNIADGNADVNDLVVDGHLIELYRARALIDMRRR